jgi:multimeric flavodoxin WrbA
MAKPYVLAINGSQRKDGNTGKLVQHALDIIAGHDIETRRINLKGMKIKDGCTGCWMCRYRNATCEIKDDLQPIFDEMVKADGIIFGAPVYWGFPPAKLKAVMERAGILSEGRTSYEKPIIDLGDPALWPVTKKGPGLFDRKLGGAITDARRDGVITAYTELLLWMTINNFIVVSSNYWPCGLGTKRVPKLNSKGQPIKLKDGVNILVEHSRTILEEDKEGRETIELFAENFAWAINKLRVKE